MRRSLRGNGQERHQARFWRFFAVISLLGALGLFPAPVVAASPPKPQGGDLANVKTMPDEGRWHLHPGEHWTYDSFPPTSGPHDPVPTPPGFYRKRQPPEKLVHALEHGNIVIYYAHPASEVMARLKKWAKTDTGRFDGVIVTPLPGLGSEVILTAWTKLLRLKPFDLHQAEAFLHAFRGKGPERGHDHHRTGK